jgi:hypothetical protein
MVDAFPSLLEEVDGRHLRYILKRAMADFSILVSFLPITDIFLSPEAWNQDWKLLKKRNNLVSPQLIVLDLVSQVHYVVLVMCILYLVLGNPRGSGFWKGEYMGKGMEMGRSVYEQPGTEVDRILSQQGKFQVSKGKQKGTKKE